MVKLYDLLPKILQKETSSVTEDDTQIIQNECVEFTIDEFNSILYEVETGDWIWQGMDEGGEFELRFDKDKIPEGCPLDSTTIQSYIDILIEQGKIIISD